MIIPPGIAASAILADPTAGLSPVPVITDANNSGSPATSSSLAVNLGTFAAGDLLVVMGDKTSGSGGTSYTSGWNMTILDWGSGDSTFLLWKIAVGSDTLTLSWPGAPYVGVRAFVIQGHDPDVAPYIVGAGGGDLPSMPVPGTAAPNNALALVCASVHPTAPTIPSGYTSEGNPQRCEIGSKELLAVPSENPGAFSGSSAVCIGIVIPAVEVSFPVGPGVYLFPTSGFDKDMFVGSGVSTMKVKLWGGGGGGGYYSGGNYGGGGGFTEAEFTVSSGQKITVQTARGGAPSAAIFSYPDGGPGSYGDTNGGGGGGSSRVWVNEVIHAVAGGGGASAGFVGWGGVGGGTSGGNGTGMGFGGTQTDEGYAGGTPGLVDYSNPGCGEGGGYWENAKDAALAWSNRHCQRGGFGGPQGGPTGGDGGGGGGGFYGGSGGGGDGRAGGGGSGHVKSTAITSSMTSGLHNDSVNSADPDYPGGNVAFGPGSNTGVWGGDGYVVVELLA